jgi:hypothetical protein
VFGENNPGHARRVLVCGAPGSSLRPPGALMAAGGLPQRLLLQTPMHGPAQQVAVAALCADCEALLRHCLPPLEIAPRKIPATFRAAPTASMQLASGSRYLVAGANTTDHAVTLARDYNRSEARDQYIRELCDAWKGDGNDREVPRIHNTGDPIADAWLDQLDDLQNAWARGSGRR